MVNDTTHIMLLKFSYESLWTAMCNMCVGRFSLSLVLSLLTKDFKDLYNISTFEHIIFASKLLLLKYNISYCHCTGFSYTNKPQNQPQSTRTSTFECIIFASKLLLLKYNISYCHCTGFSYTNKPQNQPQSTRTSTFECIIFASKLLLLKYNISYCHCTGFSYTNNHKTNHKVHEHVNKVIDNIIH